MSNMSYCRFENTQSDLEDCLEQLREGYLTNPKHGEMLSHSEFYNAVELIIKCREVADLFRYDHTSELREEYHSRCEEIKKADEEEEYECEMCQTEMSEEEHEFCDICDNCREV